MFVYCLLIGRGVRLVLPVRSLLRLRVVRLMLVVLSRCRFLLMLSRLLLFCVVIMGVLVLLVLRLLVCVSLRSVLKVCVRWLIRFMCVLRVICVMLMRRRLIIVRLIVGRLWIGVRMCRFWCGRCVSGRRVMVSVSRLY